MKNRCAKPGLYTITGWAIESYYQKEKVGRCTWAGHHIVVDEEGRTILLTGEPGRKLSADYEVVPFDGHAALVQAKPTPEQPDREGAEESPADSPPDSLDFYVDSDEEFSDDDSVDDLMEKRRIYHMPNGVELSISDILYIDEEGDYHTIVRRDGTYFVIPFLPHLGTYLQVEPT